MFRPLPEQVVVRLIAVLLLYTVTALADDATFREFPDDEVATPTDLVESLRAIDAIHFAPQRPDSIDPHSFWPNDRNREAEPRDRPERPSSPRRNGRKPRQPTRQRSNPRAKPPIPTTPPQDRRPSKRPPRESPLRIDPSQRNMPQPKRLAESLLNGRNTVQRSNRQQDVVPQGGFRDRLNRILLDAARESLEQKADGGAGLNMFERAFSKTADAMKESLDSQTPDWRKRLVNKWESATERVRESRDQSDNWLRRAAPASSSGASSGRMVPWSFAGIVLLLSVAVAFLARHRISAYLGKHPQMKLRRLRFALRTIQSRRDLIAAVDRFLLWSLGAETGCWNCRVMKQSLVAAYPQLGPQIDDLVDDYELARYAPESRIISPGQLKRCSTTLNQLVAVETANGQ